MGAYYGRGGFSLWNILLIAAGIILIIVPPYILLPIIGFGLIIAGIFLCGLFRR
jgi:hypothetical protein